MNVMAWFIRLPRYGRPMAALNRNGVDIERRPRRLSAGSRIAPAALVPPVSVEPSDRALRLPLLFRAARPPSPYEFPHIPRGTPAFA